MEKSLFQFEASWMGEAVLAELEKEGISGRLVFKPREYSSLVVGGLYDGVELFVDDADMARAQQILRRFLNPSQVSSQEFQPVTASSGESKLIPNEEKRVIILSFIGFLLPIVFNVLATLSFFRSLRQPSSLFRRSLVFVVLVLGWIASLWMLRTITASPVSLI